MKLSFSTLGCPNYTIDRAIAIAVENNYEGIELRALEGTVDLWKLPCFHGTGLTETARKLRESGLEISCVGTGISFAKADESDKLAKLETAKAYIEITKTLGCKYLRLFGGPLVPAQGYLESIEAIQDGFEAICDLTAKDGIMPLLETHDDFCAAPRVLDILSGVSSNNLGVLWDIMHPYRMGEPVAETFAKLKDKIRHVHVKDGINMSPSGSDLTLTGKGDMPIGECTALLTANGFDGYFSLEWEKMWHPEIEEPEIAIPQYAQAMGQYA